MYGIFCHFCRLHKPIIKFSISIYKRMPAAFISQLLLEIAAVFLFVYVYRIGSKDSLASSYQTRTPLSRRSEYAQSTLNIHRRRSSKHIAHRLLLALSSRLIVRPPISRLTRQTQGQLSLRRITQP